ncbi:xylulose kinase-like isoform X3 [Artemia franciscana]|uniref:xylulose kinase-like isoform X3 n=1 Tax=Artemia franciscana TaxID=6661 RepID=UPI0032DBB6E2
MYLSINQLVIVVYSILVHGYQKGNGKMYLLPMIQLKLIVLDGQLKQKYSTKVEFDLELPEFRTKRGVIRKCNDVVVAPVLMWVKALDLALDKLRASGCDLSLVAGICGCAQQHGSVYWKNNASDLLSNLDPGRFLHADLATAFSLMESPVWMDSSTSLYCRKLEDSFGNSEKLAQTTGSRAYERFTASQIAKVYDTKPGIYQITERISLISSFLASIFIGGYASIDHSDGSGMNLLDIKNRKWCGEALEAVAPGLKEKLGEVVENLTVLGQIAPYFVQRYGFNPECKVVSFTGDNPASLAGMNLGAGEVAISLGTSDTVFLSLEEGTGGLLGHVLCNPVDSSLFMGLICFKNGSLTRERIKNLCVGESWDKFNQILETTDVGNYGYIGLYYDLTEITPHIQGEYRFDPDGNLISKFPAPEMDVRACIESQAIRLRLYSERLGYSSGHSSSILITGGASSNTAILQIISNVFNAPVYTLDLPDSACLGAGYMAAYALRQSDERIPFYDYINQISGRKRCLLCTPDETACVHAIGIKVP